MIDMRVKYCFQMQIFYVKQKKTTRVTLVL